MRKKKIGYLLLSNRQNAMPSTRISVINMLPYLVMANYEPTILYEPKEYNSQINVNDIVTTAICNRLDVVYIQKMHGKSICELIDKLKSNGIKTVYGVCDLVVNEIAEQVNATIVVTDYLRSLYRQDLQNKIYVVHDGIECPEIYIKKYDNKNADITNPLKTVLVTSIDMYEIPILSKTPNYINIDVVGDYMDNMMLRNVIKELYWRTKSIKSMKERYKYLLSYINCNFKRVKWRYETVYNDLLLYDVGIIPIKMHDKVNLMTVVPPWKVKSENRLTLKMAVGLPVVASPIPSYLSVIKHGENGYLANTLTDWNKVFNELCDPVSREKLGRLARESVVNKFSKEEQARKLLNVLENL